jgi:NADH:ubiquinone oxidoreductase subunit 3 (subunit A)
MPLLNYISAYEIVQIFFIVAIAVLIAIFSIHWNLRKNRRQEEELRVVSPSKEMRVVDRGE